MSGALRHAVSRGLAKARVSPASAQCRGFAERSEQLTHVYLLRSLPCSCFQMAKDVSRRPSANAVLLGPMATSIDARSSSTDGDPSVFHRLTVHNMLLLQPRSRRHQRALPGRTARACHLHQARCRSPLIQGVSTRCIRLRSAAPPAHGTWRGQHWEMAADSWLPDIVRPCSARPLITRLVLLSMQRSLSAASMPIVQVVGVLFPVLIGGGAAWYFFGREHRPRHSSADAGSGQVPSCVCLAVPYCLLDPCTPFLLRQRLL